MSLAARIRAARLAAGIAEPAELAHRVGKRPSAAYQWEDGSIKSLKGETLLDLSEALGVCPRWLLTGKGSMQGTGSASQPVRIDPAILVSAIAFVEKRMGLDGVKLNPLRDADLLAWAYEVEARERLRLPPDNLLDFGAALRKRISDKAGTHDQGRAGGSDSG